MKRTKKIRATNMYKYRIRNDRNISNVLVVLRLQRTVNKGDSFERVSRNRIHEARIELDGAEESDSRFVASRVFVEKALYIIEDGLDVKVNLQE